MSPILNTIPSLRLRKDIWTHFPVCLIKMPYKDGRDRYAVQWHQKNLDVWCQKIPQYQNIVRMRLLNALTTSDRWIVEAPKLPGDLCIIAMQFSEEPKEISILPDLRAETIRITKVEDLKDYFPVCWKTKKNAHTLEFHNTFVRGLAQRYGIEEEEIRSLTLNRMLPALKEAGWILEAPTKPISVIGTIHKA